jgi:hypothetical protein
MSYLLNPSFEEGKEGPPWQRINIANAVEFDIASTVPDSPAVVAKSGSFFLRARSSVPGGSIAQDFVVQGVRSISAFAWVRAESVPASGALALWQLGPPDRPNMANFAANNSDWTLVTNVLDLTDVDAVKTVRVEFYLNTSDAWLLVDSVNAF